MGACPSIVDVAAPHDGRAVPGRCGSGVQERRTAIRLIGPSIAAVSVALQQLDDGRALSERFPVMRLRTDDAADGPGAPVWVAARHDVVRVFVDGAAPPRIAEALSRALSCSVSFATGVASWRKEALFHRGTLVWEEQLGAAEGKDLYRVSCAGLDLSLTVPLAEAQNEVIAAAWRQIEAHAADVVGPTRIRELEWEEA